MCLVGILAACDAQSPVSTTRPVPVSRKASASSLGSITVAPNVGGHGLYLATVVPANTLARIRVTGSIDWSPNHPAYWNEQKCDEPNREFPCTGFYSQAGSYGVVHPASVTHGAGLRIVLGASPDPASPPDLGSLFNTSGMSWEWAAGKEARPYWEGFIATAEIGAGIWYSPPGGPGNSEYVVTGEYTITVERLDLGWEMHRKHGQVEYSVSAPAGAEIRGVAWMFSRDTSSTLVWGNFSEVPECRGSTHCKHTSLSGRMFAEVRVTSEPARATGGVHGYAYPLIRFEPLVENEKPKLALTCTGDLGANRVTRGQQVTCTAVKDPASAPGELKITGWSFDGRARTDGDLTSKEWNGIMAKRGKVEVRGTIGGAALRDEQTIRVERRGWSVMRFSVPRHVVGLDPASMADYPPAGLAYGRFKPEWPDFTKLHAHGIDAGPNAGLWFLPEPIQLPQPLAFVHPALYIPALPAPLGPGSPGYSQWILWYNDQNGRPVGTCRPQEVTQFRSNVEVHEGVTGATNSHWGVGNRVLTSTKLHERFEALTSDQGADDLRFRTNDTWQKWLAGPYRSSQNQFDTSDYPNVFNLGCSLDSNPNDS
jgi:hypothetical protein